MARKKEGDTAITVPAPLQALHAKGPKCREVVERVLEATADDPLFQTHHVDLGTSFADIADWKDDWLVTVLNEVVARLRAGNTLDAIGLRRWLRAHVNDADSVLDCLNVNPPREISITRVLSRAGSQKVVFLASWLLAQKDVVLKLLKGPPEVQKNIILRELQPHPLSLLHPNIIQTHLMKNDAGEPFLVEHLLPKVLNDGWSSGGIHEAANLFRDIASALDFLKAKALVHGDVKPDNIGIEGGRYILLDFGICRPADSFTEDTTATGSLRTRAPELLVGPTAHSHASDVWGLAATVFNALAGRFPLFAKEEKPPRVSKPEDRAGFEAELKRRVEAEWDTRVALATIPDPMRDILRQALDRDPARRPSAGEIVRSLESTLAAYLRPASGVQPFSPIEELGQLVKYIPSERALRMMPELERQRLRDRVAELKVSPGLSESQRKELELVGARIG